MNSLRSLGSAADHSVELLVTDEASDLLDCEPLHQTRRGGSGVLEGLLVASRRCGEDSGLVDVELVRDGGALRREQVGDLFVYGELKRLLAMHDGIQLIDHTRYRSDAIERANLRLFDRPPQE